MDEVDSGHDDTEGPRKAKAGGGRDARVAGRATGRATRLRLVDDGPDRPNDDGDRARIGGPLVAAAREEVRRRADRRLLLGGDFSADPGWDMLLELYLAQAGGDRVAISALCAAAAIPTTTALRWIGALESDGLILRERDPTDGRRSFASLTSSARATMDRLLRRSLDRPPVD